MEEQQECDPPDPPRNGRTESCCRYHLKSSSHASIAKRRTCGSTVCGKTGLIKSVAWGTRRGHNAVAPAKVFVVVAKTLKYYRKYYRRTQELLSSTATTQDARLVSGTRLVFEEYSEHSTQWLSCTPKELVAYRERG